MKIHRLTIINLQNASVHTVPVILFIKFEFSRQMFPESSNIKFRENPCSGSRFVLRGRTDDKDDEAVVALRDFANVSGICQVGKIKVYFLY